VSPHNHRFFKLSSAGRLGLSCDANGAFVDDIPLLRKVDVDGDSVWTSRPVGELSDEIASRYDLPVDLSSRAGGLDAIARAFNAGDLALAQTATVLLAIPERPHLSKGVHPREAREQFIRELHSGGLIKADWDPDEHPRWPAGSPDSKGGEFAPKDEAPSNALRTDNVSSRSDAPSPRRNTGDNDASSDESEAYVASEHDSDFDANAPTVNRSDDALAALADAMSVGHSETEGPVAAVERGEDEGLLDQVVYRGHFHDEVVQGLAQMYRKHGYKVETEIPLEMADGSGGARIDMVVESPEGLISGLEVKTGDDPFFTRAQLYVYPHLMMGMSVITPDVRIRNLGLPPMTLLQPMPLLLFYLQDSNSHQETNWQDPWKLLQEYKRRFGAGGTRKFEREAFEEEELRK
jgi:hypothetical protein